MILGQVITDEKQALYHFHGCLVYNKTVKNPLEYFHSVDNNEESLEVIFHSQQYKVFVITYCVCVCLSVFACACMFVRVCVCMWVSVYTCLCMSVYLSLSLYKGVLAEILARRAKCLALFHLS